MTDPLRADWTPQQAFQQQVEREDLVRWAREVPLVQKVVPPIQPMRMKKAALKVFISQMTP